MSRALSGLVAILLAIPGPLLAQASDAQTGTPPERIDLLADARADAQNPPGKNCSPDQDGIETEGPIIVCREGYDPEAAGYNREEAKNRYAAQTMDKGDPRTPDVAGAGIFKGPATVGHLCIPGLQKCPPPPAYMIDFKSLPEAPAGSDADRIARGLPPRGVAEPAPPKVEPPGLPAPSPSGSASPAAAPSD